jgi:hypothetical protein
MTTRPCRACGREITFAPGPNGKEIPLERITDPYSLDWNPVSERFEAVPRSFAEDTYISHFKTCPVAGEFSKKQKTS